MKWIDRLIRQSRIQDEEINEFPLPLRRINFVFRTALYVINIKVYSGCCIEYTFMHQFRGRRHFYCFIVHLKLWVYAFRLIHTSCMRVSVRACWFWIYSPSNLFIVCLLFVSQFWFYFVFDSIEVKKISFSWCT